MMQSPFSGFYVRYLGHLIAQHEPAPDIAPQAYWDTWHDQVANDPGGHGPTVDTFRTKA
jgi:hypothetical protein